MNLSATIYQKKIFKKYSFLDFIELGLRVWMGYILIKNSSVGTITPLKELGLPVHIHNIMQGMWDTGFMMHLVKFIELFTGICLILNFHTPLVVIIILPVLVNIYGVHIFLFNSYFTKALAMLLIAAFLIFKYRKQYRPLFKSTPLVI